MSIDFEKHNVRTSFSKAISDTDYLALIKDYEDVLYKIAYMYFRNEADSLEVVSETVYRSYKYKKSIKDSKYFKTWITKILINVCNSYLKQKKKYILKDTEIEKDTIYIDTSSSSDDKILIDEALSLLRYEYKTVLLLRYYQDFSVKETAKIMKIPANTVKTYTSRALREMKKYLKEDDYE